MKFGDFRRDFGQFDRDNLVCSASIDTYLLEKSRIVTHTPGERAYHSFYQVRARVTVRFGFGFGLGLGLGLTLTLTLTTTPFYQCFGASSAI